MLAFSIYDRKPKRYSLPFFQVTIEAASREFKNLVNDPQSSLNKNPEDYTLFQIGEFDETEGTLTSSTIAIVDASEVITINEAAA